MAESKDGLPHAIASIITKPKGSGQSIGNKSEGSTKRRWCACSMKSQRFPVASSDGKFWQGAKAGGGHSEN
jgi:hypothetical protein